MIALLSSLYRAAVSYGIQCQPFTIVFFVYMYMYMQVYPTQTVYTFEQDGIQLNLTVSVGAVMYVCCFASYCFGKEQVQGSLKNVQ